MAKSSRLVEPQDLGRRSDTIWGERITSSLEKESSISSKEKVEGLLSENDGWRKSLGVPLYPKKMSSQSLECNDASSKEEVLEIPCTF